MGFCTQDRAVSSPYRWVILIFAYLAFFSQYADYLSWNPFIPIASETFGLSMKQAGSIVAAVALGRTVFQIPGGILVDRLKVKTLLAISLVFLGISTVITGLTGTYWGVLISQFFIGVTSVAVWPLCIKLVIDWFSESEKDVVAGFLLTGMTIAISVTNTFIPYAIRNLGWSSAFYMLGAMSILVAIAVVFIMKSTQIPSGETSVVNKPRFNLLDVSILLKNQNFLCGLVVYTGALCTTWGANTWLTTYLIRKAGVPISEASFMMFLFGICGAVSMPLAGIITKGNMEKRRKLITVNLMLLAIMLVCLPWIENRIFLWGYMIILGVVAFAYNGPLNLMVAELVEKRLSGTAMAVSLFAVQIGLMIQPLLIGVVLDSIALSIAYHIIFWILAAGACVGCILVMRIK